MTLIVGIEENNKVWLGGDSGIFDETGQEKALYQEEKVFRKSGFLFGGAGSIRLCQVIKYHFSPPQLRPREDPYRFMVKKFTKSLAKCLEKYANYLLKGELDLDLMVGYKGRIYSIDSEFGVFRDEVNRYNAIGAGSDIAKGVLYSLAKIDKDKHPPDFRMKMAFEATSRFNTLVASPWKVMTI